MRLNERIKAIERRALPVEHGVVVVLGGEAVEDAIKRTALSAARIRMGCIIVPAKQESRQCQ